MEYIEAAAPSRDLRIAYLDRTTSCPGLPTDLLAEIDSAILQEEPTSVGPVRREAQRLVTLGRMDEAIGLLERALLDHADSENLWVALIRTQLSAGEPQQARLALEEAKSGGLETRLSLESQARVEAALGQADAMRATLTRLRGQSRGDARLIASSLILGGALEASLGNIDEALAAYTAADVASPNTPALQYAAALALKSERPTQARRLYRTLCRREPDGRACAQEARLSKDLSPAPPRGPVP
jgi:tetratricopeptide (TPR) repeat protein